MARRRIQTGPPPIDKTAPGYSPFHKPDPKKYLVPIEGGTAQFPSKKKVGHWVIRFDTDEDKLVTVPLECIVQVVGHGPLAAEKVYQRRAAEARANHSPLERVEVQLLKRWTELCASGRRVALLNNGGDTAKVTSVGKLTDMMTSAVKLTDKAKKSKEDTILLEQAVARRMTQSGAAYASDTPHAAMLTAGLLCEAAQRKMRIRLRELDLKQTKIESKQKAASKLDDPKSTTGASRWSKMKASAASTMSVVPVNASAETKHLNNVQHCGETWECALSLYNEAERVLRGPGAVGQSMFVGTMGTLIGGVQTTGVGWGAALAVRVLRCRTIRDAYRYTQTANSLVEQREAKAERTARAMGGMETAKGRAAAASVNGDGVTSAELKRQMRALQRAMDAAANDVVRGIADLATVRQVQVMVGAEDAKSKAQLMREAEERERSEKLKDEREDHSKEIAAKSKFKGVMGKVFKINRVSAPVSKEGKKLEEEEKKDAKSKKRDRNDKGVNRSSNKRQKIPTLPVEMAALAAAAAAVYSSRAVYGGYGERHIDLHSANLSAEIEVLHETAEGLRACGLDRTALWRLEQATEKAAALLHDCKTAERTETAIHRREESLRDQKSNTGRMAKFDKEKKAAGERLGKDAEAARLRQEEFDEHVRIADGMAKREHGLKALSGGWVWGVGWLGIGIGAESIYDGTYTAEEDEEEAAARVQKEEVQKELDEKERKRQEALAVLAASVGMRIAVGSSQDQAKTKQADDQAAAKTQAVSEARRMQVVAQVGPATHGSKRAQDVVSVDRSSGTSNRKKHGSGGPNMYPSVWRALRFRAPPKTVEKNTGIALLMTTRNQRVERVSKLRKLDIVLGRGRLSIDPWGEKGVEQARLKEEARVSAAEKKAVYDAMVLASQAGQSTAQARDQASMERQLKMLGKSKGKEALAMRKEWRHQGKNVVRASKVYWSKLRTERAELRLAACHFAQAMILGQRLGHWADYAARSSSSTHRNAKLGALSLFELAKQRRTDVLGLHHELTEEAARWVRQAKTKLKHGDSKKKAARQAALTKLLGSGSL
jgi:hypothetical protein